MHKWRRRATAEQPETCGLTHAPCLLMSTLFNVSSVPCVWGSASPASSDHMSLLKALQPS